MNSIQELQADIQDLLEGTSDIVFTLDKDWTILRGNKNFFDYTPSLPPEQQIGKNFLELYLYMPDAKNGNYWINYHLAMAERVSLCFEDYYAPLEKWNRVTVHPNSSGGLNIFVKDSTVEKAKINNDSRLYDFFMQAPVPMCMFEGPEHIFTIANPHYEKFVSRKVLGKNLREAFPAGEADLYIPILDGVYSSGKPFTGKEMPVDLPDDDGGSKRFWIDLGYYPFRNSAGVIKGIMVILLDVTDSVTARMKVEEVVLRLEAEKNTREQFVAALSHDLRTPLTAAKLSAEVMARKLAGDPNMLRSAHRIADNMNRADTMIRDLLDANMIKAGEKVLLKIQPCHLNHIVQEVIEDVSEIHGDRFRMKSDSEISGYWDYQGVKRIIENLLSNAVKYGQLGTEITVKLEKQDSQTLLSVHNFGQPIPQKDQETLFEIYKRTSSAHGSGQKGWGLGLTLVKGIAESHGGIVSVSSDQSSGTSFMVKLPTDAR